MNNLLFIDTNILLDFYRVRNDFSKPFVEHIEKIAGCMICTYQVEMEFKKNRQSAILDGLSCLKAPATISRPGILSKDRSYHALTKDIKKAERRIKALQDRLGRVMEDPIRHDPIYKVLQRVFKKEDCLALHRGTPTAHRIRRLALKRFMLGYPPRKKNDTSIGDAVNWEWIIDCAQREKSSVMIVSRDADYGIERDSKGHVNDWLREEFRERVGKKAKLRLTPLLSVALREFKVPVSSVAAKREMNLVMGAKSSSSGPTSTFISRIQSLDKEDAIATIDTIIAETITELTEHDLVAGVMAQTNADGWDVDDYSIVNINLATDPIEVTLLFHASGDQIDDKMYSGTKISGNALARIDTNGAIEYEVIDAKVAEYDE